MLEHKKRGWGTNEENPQSYFLITFMLVLYLQCLLQASIASPTGYSVSKMAEILQISNRGKKKTWYSESAITRCNCGLLLTTIQQALQKKNCNGSNDYLGCSLQKIKHPKRRRRSAIRTNLKVFRGITKQWPPCT